MLELFIRFLQANFLQVKYFDQVLSLAQQVRKEGVRFPAIYNTKDNYKRIDLENSTLYFRKRGDITREENAAGGISGCDDLITVTIPLIAVAYLPKDTFQTDNAFIDQKVTSNIANIIQRANWKQLQTTLKAMSIMVRVNQETDDRETVWRQEYEGVPLAARFDHVYCSVSFDLVVQITESCLLNFECNDVEVVYSPDAVIVYTTDKNAWHQGGDQVTAVRSIGTKNEFGFDVLTNNVVRWKVTSAGDIYPSLNNTYSFGTASKKIKEIHVGTLYYDTLDPAINIDVLNTVLSGLVVTGTTITAADTILTAFGKTQNQINALIGGVTYQGAWNANTNTPTLASGVGTKGYYYVVSVPGSTNLDGITDWKLGDWAIYNGTAWEKVDNTDAVISVNGQVGIVVLNTDNINEGASNLYFTNTRARNALSGTAPISYDSATGVISSIAATASVAGHVTAVDQSFGGTKKFVSADFQCVVLANNETNSSGKDAVLCGAPFLNASKNWVAIGLGDDGTMRTMNFGGRGYNMPDVNRINFFTALNYNQTDNASVLRGFVNNLGNWVFGPGATTINARVNIAGAANSRAIVVETDDGAFYIECIEAAGVRQMGFFGVTPVIRQVVPTGSSTDTVITALQNLGLFSQT